MCLHTDLHSHSGDKVQGKRLIASFTSGTLADTYVEGGLQSYPMDYFMYPLIALANRCGMKWDGYVYTGGVMAAFADAAEFPSDTPLLVVMPVGYPAEKKSLKEKMMRATLGRQRHRQYRHSAWLSSSHR